ncbi:hypothetical protein BCR33DRAFT_722686 [Rhizoclosmatium globosum]|uniref:Uncharacterized protein n=1 Tax=Rhizoclosmatium globosum TaxID=329046 RepID=A0A1Y2BKA1_9FUNG|nr:hypothetical protein BCR33DRAFT_722686 [Rhizoclosmatium globosum]|eukprot:ORY34535.1 hypothetical protein BCR33DRAFT_722686 [Rhizoclosmatium globosum]
MNDFLSIRLALFEWQSQKRLMDSAYAESGNKKEFSRHVKSRIAQFTGCCRNPNQRGIQRIDIPTEGESVLVFLPLSSLLPHSFH